MKALNIFGVLCPNLKTRPYATLGQFRAQRTKKLKESFEYLRRMARMGQPSQGHLSNESDYPYTLLVSLEEVTALSIDEFCQLKLNREVKNNQIIFGEKKC